MSNKTIYQQLMEDHEKSVVSSLNEGKIVTDSLTNRGFAEKNGIEVGSIPLEDGLNYLFKKSGAHAERR